MYCIGAGVLIVNLIIAIYTIAAYRFLQLGLQLAILPAMAVAVALVIMENCFIMYKIHCVIATVITVVFYFGAMAFLHQIN